MPDLDDTSFYTLQTKYDLAPEVQIELLLDFAESQQPEYKSWLAVLDKELGAHLPEKTEMPVTHTSALDAFFDRDLALRALPQLTRIEPADMVVETNSCFPDGEYFTLLEDVVNSGKTLTEEPFNAILGGYYYQMPDAVILIMVMNGDAHGAPYVDAVMILHADTPYRDVPNISLEPRTSLAGTYSFEHPGGSIRIINLWPTT